MRIGRTPTPVEDGFLIGIDLSQFNSVNATDISIIDQMNAASLSFVCGPDSSGLSGTPDDPGRS